MSARPRSTSPGTRRGSLGKGRAIIKRMLSKDRSASVDSEAPEVPDLGDASPTGPESPIASGDVSPAEPSTPRSPEDSLPEDEDSVPDDDAELSRATPSPRPVVPKRPKRVRKALPEVSMADILTRVASLCESEDDSLVKRVGPKLPWLLRAWTVFDMIELLPADSCFRLMVEDEDYRALLVRCVTATPLDAGSRQLVARILGDVVDTRPRPVIFSLFLRHFDILTELLFPRAPETTPALVQTVVRKVIAKDTQCVLGDRLVRTALDRVHVPTDTIKITAAHAFWSDIVVSYDEKMMRRPRVFTSEIQTSPSIRMLFAGAKSLSCFDSYVPMLSRVLRLFSSCSEKVEFERVFQEELVRVVKFLLRTIKGNEHVPVIIAFFCEWLWQRALVDKDLQDENDLSLEPVIEIAKNELVRVSEDQGVASKFLASCLGHDVLVVSIAGDDAFVDSLSRAISSDPTVFLVADALFQNKDAEAALSPESHSKLQSAIQSVRKPSRGYSVRRSFRKVLSRGSHKDKGLSAVTSSGSSNATSPIGSLRTMSVAEETLPDLDDAGGAAIAADNTDEESSLDELEASLVLS